MLEIYDLTRTELCAARESDRQDAASTLSLPSLYTAMRLQYWLKILRVLDVHLDTSHGKKKQRTTLHQDNFSACESCEVWVPRPLIMRRLHGIQGSAVRVCVWSPSVCREQCNDMDVSNPCRQPITEQWGGSTMPET